MTFLRHFVGALAFISLAQTAYAAPLEPVCDDVEHCIYILERHAPDSFDYSVLHEEFLDFGPKATEALVEVAAWMEDPKSSYALQMLARGGFQLTPAQQRDLIEVWPRENVKAHAIVLGRMASPLVRAAAIDSLDHADPNVRIQSRYLLSEVAKARFKFPMRQGDYSKLLRAALNEPHPALIALLETYPPSQLRPAYTRLLRSGDTATTAAVYAKLFQADKENALKTLVGVIQDLKDNELPAALSISKMLQQRNLKRPDGFYLKFAKDITADAKLNLAGRAVGYDMLINSASIPDTALNREVFEYIVANSEYGQAYVNYLDDLTSKNADPYIAAIGNSSSQSPNSNFILKLGAFQTPLAKDIVAKALSHGSDFYMITAAMMSAAKQKQIQIKSAIGDHKLNHPVSAVRVAATLALKEFEQSSQKSSENLFGQSHMMISAPLYKTVNAGAVYCKVEGVNFKNLSRKMPYFEPGRLSSGLSAGRQDLDTAAELKSGWLAGYNKGEFGGGLIYYDYKSQSSVRLLDDNILAIIPTQKIPLGQYPTSFWVITGLSHMTIDKGELYRVSQIEGNFEVNLHAVLPSPPQAIAINSDNSIAMDFLDYESLRRNPKLNRTKYLRNPPLLLEPNGGIRRLCETGAGKPTDSTP